MRKGLVQVYTGDGKGKTTAAIGVAVRAFGDGMSVAFVQFIKSTSFRYNEMKTLEAIKVIEGKDVKFFVEQFGTGCCIHTAPTDADYKAAEKGLETARKLIHSGEWDLIVLDEISVALYLKLIKEEDVIELINSRPSHVELILTGRGMPESIINVADLVTEMKEVKHYFRNGIKSRPGIDC